MNALLWGEIASGRDSEQGALRQVARQSHLAQALRRGCRSDRRLRTRRPNSSGLLGVALAPQMDSTKTLENRTLKDRIKDCGSFHFKRRRLRRDLIVFEGGSCGAQMSSPREREDKDGLKGATFPVRPLPGGCVETAGRVGGSRGLCKQMCLFRGCHGRKRYLSPLFERKL